MISTVVFAVLCAVVQAYEEEPKYFKVITVMKKFAEPKGMYQEEVPNGKYPVFIPQSYPIYIEKRMPYGEGTEQRPYGVQYDKPQPQDPYQDKKSYHGSITPIGRDEEDRYGKGEVIRSPVIFAVRNKSVFKRMPYPLKHLSDQEKTPGRFPCPDEDVPHLHEEYYYPGKSIGHNVYKSDDKPSSIGNEKVKVIHFGGKLEFEKPIVFSGQGLPSEIYYEKDGSIHHKEVFQTPVLVAEEKPGFKYIKHLVGAGELPEGKQYQVVILEEDEDYIPPQDKPVTTEEPGKDVNNKEKSPDQKDLYKKEDEEGKPEDNKNEGTEEVPTNVTDESLDGPVSTEEPSTGNGRITFPNNGDSEASPNASEISAVGAANPAAGPGDAEVTNLGENIDVKIKS